MSTDRADSDGEPSDLPRWLLQSGAAAWRFLAVALAVYVVAWLVGQLTVVVLPVALALLLTGVLEPAVRRFDGGRLPDWAAPLIAVLVVMIVVMGASAGLGARIADQLPELRTEFDRSLQQLEDRFSVDLPSLPGGGGDTTSTAIGQDSAVQAVSLGAELVFGFFLTLALTFLFLRDGRDLWAWALAKLGEGARAEVDEAGRAAWSVVGTYVRGLTIVALFDAAGIGLGLLALGVPLLLTLVALQFVASYVPTIGAFVAAGVASVVAFGSRGIVTAALTLVVALVVQVVGNNVVEPWVMGRSLPIHPVVVLVAVSAGAVVWGITGALLFVPLTAGLSAAGHVLWERHHTTARRRPTAA